jgi:hypothetical protein
MTLTVMANASVPRCVSCGLWTTHPISLPRCRSVRLEYPGRECYGRTLWAGPNWLPERITGIYGRWYATMVLWNDSSTRVLPSRLNGYARSLTSAESTESGTALRAPRSSTVMS